MVEVTPLFSVTVDDCEVQTFCSGGKGGQHQNRIRTGVRIIHRPSGARGEARDSRSQLSNKRAAFERMANSETFQRWCRIEAAYRMGAEKRVKERVEQQMAPKNIRIEVREGVRWIVL